MSWTTATAGDYVTEINPLFRRYGMSLQIVGSVATKGHSDKDLDLKICVDDHLSPMDLERALDIVLKPEFQQGIKAQPDLAGPNDSFFGGWFINIGLPDGRVVEFFFPEDQFSL